MGNKISRFTNNLMTSGIEGGYESEPVRKAILINLFSLIAFLFMTYFGIQTLISYNPGYSLILFSFSLATAAVFIYLRITKKYLHAGYGIVFLMTILELYFLITGGVENTAILWFYVYPILCLFTLGLKRALVFISLMVSIVVVLFIWQPEFFPEYYYNFKLRFVSTLTAVSLMAIVFEFVRSATYKTMLEADKKKTYYLNKVLDQQKELEQHKNNLEQMVQERTAELEIEKVKAEESDKLKSAFLANMSHEIRTPMNAIVGFSSLIVEPDTDPELKKEMVNHLVNSTNSLLQLMEDIIDVSKIESGQMRLSYAISNINALMTELYQNFADMKTDANKNKISFFYDNANIRDEVLINTDPFRLRQILTSLLDNAFKFTDEGQINFGFNSIKNENGEFLKFYVKDTGIGLSDEHKKYIFKRFTKAENSRKKLYRGAGLGLSLCKSLIEIYGGDIWYDSVLAEGTSFYFTIPFNEVGTENTNQISKKIIPERINWENRNILIADDEESNLLYFKNLFLKTNANIFLVNNGQDAVDFVKENPVDLILMDIKMPVMNGLEATRIIKGMGKMIPIIALTAYTLEQDEKVSLDNGCDAFIAKPVKESNIFRLVNEFLAD